MYYLSQSSNVGVQTNVLVPKHVILYYRDVSYMKYRGLSKKSEKKRVKK